MRRICAVLSYYDVTYNRQGGWSGYRDAGDQWCKEPAMIASRIPAVDFRHVENARRRTNKWKNRGQVESRGRRVENLLCVFLDLGQMFQQRSRLYSRLMQPAQPLILIFALPRRRTVIFQRWKQPIEKFASHEEAWSPEAARFFTWMATSSLIFWILLPEGSTRQWRRAIILVRRLAQVTTVKCRELQSGFHVKTTKGDSRQFIVGRAAGTTARWDKLLLDLCRVCRKRRPFLPFCFARVRRSFPGNLARNVEPNITLVCRKRKSINIDYRAIIQTRYAFM